MGAFYYRPIDPGYAQAGAGIARGIDQGVANFQGGKDRKRRRAAEDRQNEIDQVRLDIMLGEAGGGRGPIPNDPVDLPEPGSALNDQTGLSIRADAPTSRPRPGMIPVGPEGFAYIEDPERRATRLADQKYKTEQARAGEESTRLGAAGTALMAGRQTPEDVGTLAQAGVPWEDLMGTRTPRRGTQEYLDMLDAEQGVYDQHQNPYTAPRGPRDPGVPTFSQAESFLWNEFGDDLTADERFNAAQAAARGENIWDETPLRPDRGAMAGYDEAQIDAVMGGRPKRSVSQEARQGRSRGGPGSEVAPGVSPPNRPAAAPSSRERTPPDVPAASGVSDEEIPSIREALSRFPQRRWEQILRDQGVSDTDIDRIVGR